MPIFVVLCGSEVGFFEREVVGYSATTYGRRAGQLRLRPFAPTDVGFFLPKWSPEDRIAAYAVFGGRPYYLAHVRPEASLADNILDLVLVADGLLHEEARLLLAQELPDPAAHFSILRAIAAGQTRSSQIAARTGIAPARVGQMLDTLRAMWLVTREHPVTVRNPERSRQSFYRIADPYLRFWFRFVLPSEDRLIDREGAERHLRRRVLPQLDEFVAAPAFEEVCQQWLRREVDRELDAVAVDDDGRVLAIGSCKWTTGKLPYAEKARLEALAGHLAGDGAPPPRLFYFARAGFDARLAAAAERDDRLRLVTPAELSNGQATSQAAGRS